MQSNKIQNFWVSYGVISECLGVQKRLRSPAVLKTLPGAQAIGPEVQQFLDGTVRKNKFEYCHEVA